MKKLAFGLMRLPFIGDEYNNIDKEKAKAMVDEFIKRGFTYFDTAYVYHGGNSEKAFGELVASRYDHSQYTVTTKMPMFSDKTPEEYEKIFNEQLERCQVEYFDWYFLHCLSRNNYENRVQKDDAFAFISKKKAEGKIKHIGFSFHDNAEFLDKILTDHPEVELVQLQLNYIDWDSESVQARKCYEVCVKHGKDVAVMEPLKGGRLINIPEEAQKVFKEANPDLSIASWGIRFAASLPNVIIVLSGMSTLEQVEDNTSFMQDFVPLNDAEQDTIKKVVKIINDAIEIPCTGCKYCVDGCPMHIAIPSYFALLNEQKQFGFNDGQVSRYKKIAENNGLASVCLECGQCESVCPQHLPVIEALKKVANKFEK